MTLHDEADLPLERVLTLLDWGGYLRRTGQLVRARGQLSDALRAAEAHGAGWLAEQAHEELRFAGGRRRAPRPEGLTPQEERVAGLAASGHSNREIADRLHLSAHTVKTHLERIYAKKGLRSRRELMHTGAAAAGLERPNLPTR
jgi:DNA-binding CsgD family transcriptional regulator